MSQSETSTLIDTQAPLSISVRASVEPLKPTGVLDQYEHVDLTPVIGREYHNVQLTELLKAENADELIRELAIIGETNSEGFDNVAKHRLSQSLNATSSSSEIRTSISNSRNWSAISVEILRYDDSHFHFSLATSLGHCPAVRNTLGFTSTPKTSLRPNGTKRYTL